LISTLFVHKSLPPLQTNPPIPLYQGGKLILDFPPLDKEGVRGRFETQPRKQRGI